MRPQSQYPGIAQWVKDVKAAIASGKYSGRRTGGEGQLSKKHRYLRKGKPAGSAGELARKGSVELLAKVSGSAASSLDGEGRASMESSGEAEPIEALVPETHTLEQVRRDGNICHVLLRVQGRNFGLMLNPNCEIRFLTPFVGFHLDPAADTWFSVSQSRAYAEPLLFNEFIDACFRL